MVVYWCSGVLCSSSRPLFLGFFEVTVLPQVTRLISVCACCRLSVRDGENEALCQDSHTMSRCVSNFAESNVSGMPGGELEASTDIIGGRHLPMVPCDLAEA